MTHPSSSPGVRRRTFLKLMGAAAGITVALGAGGLWLPVRRTQARPA